MLDSFRDSVLLLAQGPPGDESSLVLYTVGIGIALVIGFFLLVLIIMMMIWGNLWFQAYMTSADVSLSSLIGMSIRQVNPRVIVLAKTMAAQSGLDINRRTGISTKRLEAHYMSEGNVMNVIQALIAAQRANIDLDFDKAAAIDLAGRDVLDAVRTSVQPKVIDCPDPVRSGKNTLSAIARDGVELRVRARVTVRTNLEQLIGGATEETIIARVGESIISSIGSSADHKKVLANPDLISKAVLARGLDAQTAFEIVSIDIADVDVGERIGARLQVDQAEADTRVARARAEQKRAEAIAITQENRARVAENRARLVLAEAAVPRAMAGAIKIGNLHGGIASAERDASDDMADVPMEVLTDEELADDERFRAESEARMQSLGHSVAKPAASGPTADGGGPPEPAEPVVEAGLGDLHRGEAGRGDDRGPEDRAEERRG